MSIAGLIIIIVLLGTVLWAINALWTTADAKVKLILNFVILFIVILVVLQAFGLLDWLKETRVPKL
jgi:uncharacterized membrane protein